jgi:two-component system response regulator GlrR
MTQKDTITESDVLQTKIVAVMGDKTPSAERLSLGDGRLKPLKDARDAFERDYLVQVLSMTEGNVSQAARLAGKYRADFYELLKKHDLKVDDFKKNNPVISN